MKAKFLATAAVLAASVSMGATGVLAAPVMTAGACVPGSFGAQCAAAVIAGPIGTPGVLSVPSQTVGAFTLSGSSTGSTTTTTALFNSQTLTLSTTTGGLLNVYFTISDIPTQQVPDLFVTSFTSNNQTSLGAHAVNLASYLSNTDGLFQNGLQTLLASATLTSAILQTSGPDSSTQTPGALVSITEVYQIELLGCSAANPCTSNVTIDLTTSQIPEPASIALLGAGLLGFGSITAARRRRRR